MSSARIMRMFGRADAGGAAEREEVGRRKEERAAAVVAAVSVVDFMLIVGKSEV